MENTVTMMSLPSAQTPLNCHSLRSLEKWLQNLGAERNANNPCLWIWTSVNWTAEIQMKRDELSVIWSNQDKRSECFFSYGLSREDVEIAIRQGP